MATIVFSRAQVMRALGLPNTEAVEDLVRARVLDVHSYTLRGAPLFEANSVKRAAPHVLTDRESRSE